jgi:hypothetical protein
MTKVNNLSLLKTLIKTGVSLTKRTKWLINIQLGAELEVGKKICIFFSLLITHPAVVNLTHRDASDTNQP